MLDATSVAIGTLRPLQIIVVDFIESYPTIHNPPTLLPSPHYLNVYGCVVEIATTHNRSSSN